MHERVRRAPRPCICGPAGSVSPVRVSTNVEAPASTLSIERPTQSQEVTDGTW